MDTVLKLDPEALIRQEKLSRQLHTPLRTTRLLTGKFFEQFLVIGCIPGPSNLEAAPSVLYRYPEGVENELQALEEFAFPSGMGLYNAARAGTLSETYKSVIIYHGKHPFQSFVFMLTSEIKESLYAVCIMDDYLQPFPSFVPSPGLLPSNYNRTRCYMFISKFPFFTLHLEVLYSILGAEETNINLTMGGIPPSPNLVSNILKTYYETPVPTPGASVDLALQNVSPVHRASENEDEEEQCMSEFCLPILFWALPKDQILTLASAILLEKKPYMLQCVIIPLLPDRLSQITQAPVPFIIGLANIQLVQAEIANKDVIIVDLDKKTLTIPPGLKVPPLPNAREISKAFTAPLQDLTRSFSKLPPYDSSPSQRAFAQTISEIFEKLTGPFFQRFKHHCVTNLTDHVTIFLKDSYMAEEASDETWDWFESFLETQIFQVYCDKKLKDIDNFQEKNRLTPEQARQQASAASTGQGAAGAASTDLGDSGETPSYTWQVSQPGDTPEQKPGVPSPKNRVVMHVEQKDVPSSLKRPIDASQQVTPRLDPRSPKASAAHRKSAPIPHTRSKSDTGAPSKLIKSSASIASITTSEPTAPAARSPPAIEVTPATPPIPPERKQSDSGATAAVVKKKKKVVKVAKKDPAAKEPTPPSK